MQITLKMRFNVYWYYAEWNLTYSENSDNTRNETFCILRIREMKLSIFWEFAEGLKIWIFREKSKLRRLIKISERFFWVYHTSLIQKIYASKCNFRIWWTIFNIPFVLKSNISLQCRLICRWRINPTNL
jgi:hypothetical protein